MISKINEIRMDHSQSQTKINFTLKILFGPMYGSELHLIAEDYFIIINSGSVFTKMKSESIPAQDHPVNYTHNTLYIPCDVPSPNLLLRLSKFLDSDEVNNTSVEIYGLSDMYETTLSENKIFMHQHIRFAFKRTEDEWHPEIRDYNSLHADKILLLEKGEKTKSKTKGRMLIYFFLFSLVACLIGLPVYWHKKKPENSHLLNLSEALAGSSSPLIIVKSRDEKSIFVLVQNLPDMEWVKEALFKLKENQSVIAVSLKQQQQHNIRKLLQADHPVLQLDYSSPQHPVIAVYRQLNHIEETSLKTDILENIPYASDVRIIFKSKDDLLNDARNGLDKLNVYYRQFNTETGYSLIIHDALNDVTLRNLRYFITDFERKWGNTHIKLTINLEEDWMINKSYFDSTNGYLFLNPRHWYFPLKSGDINRD